MENPKQVHRALITMIMTSGIGCIGLYYICGTPGRSLSGVYSGGIGDGVFAMVTVLYGVTIWPVLLLIGYIFDRPSKHGPAAGGSRRTTRFSDRGQRRGKTRPARPAAAERSVRPKETERDGSNTLSRTQRGLAGVG